MKRLFCLALVLVSLSLVASSCPDSGNDDSKKGGGARLKIVYVNGSQLRMMNLDGSKDTLILNVPGATLQRPRIHPDGKRIGYFKNTGEYSGTNFVSIVNTNGTNNQEILNTGSSGWGGFCDFSPDGADILYFKDTVAGGGQNYDIFKANINGTGEVNLTNDANNSGGGDYSPDGLNIVYMSGPPFSSEDVDLKIMDSDGSNQALLIDAEGGQDSLPDFSPDGAEVVFSGRSGAGDPMDIFTVNDDGTGLANVSNSGGVAEEPVVWTPNGQKLVYSAGGQIWIMNIDGTGDTQLTTTGGTDPHCDFVR